ncbi:MAG TPA: transporter substrate-binding domain-containing protein [Stellaceae bacterium]|nr:transporter substrate-binding domain-containing protein [Stellaceae bacterium]
MGASFKIVAALAAALAIAMPTAWAAEDGALARIKQAGVLRIGTTGDYKPFSYKTADGALIGADIEMAKDLAATLGVRPDFVPTTWKTLLEDFKADKFDVALGGITINPDRAAIGDFSVPNVSDGKRPIVRCGDKDKYTSLDAIDQPATRAVTNPGGTNDKFAHEHFQKAQLAVWPDNKTIFEQLVTNQADVMVTDGVEVDLQSKLHPGVLCPAAVSAPFTHFDDAYLMRKDKPLKQVVDGWMQQAIATGKWRKALDGAMQ